MSNIEKFFALLATADAVIIDDGAMLTDWETEERTGEPDNQVVRFSWTDGACDYSDILDEEGITDGVFDSDGKFVAENTEGEKTVIRFFVVSRLSEPFVGPKAAKQFMQELLDAVETLTGVAEEHGARTLADLMYLHSAILQGGFIDHYPDESKVLDIAQSLPSGEQWAKFFTLWQAECSRGVTGTIVEARPSWLDGGLEALELAREDGKILDECQRPLEGYITFADENCQA